MCSDHAHKIAPCMQANKRHIQLLDDHLHSFTHSASDARVITSYFTGSWTIIQPTLTPCKGDCGLPACSRCTIQSVSSALSTDVTFLSDAFTHASNAVAPLGPGEWGSDDEDATAMPGTAANRQTISHVPSATAAMHARTTLKSIASAKPPGGEHTQLAADREGASWEAASGCNGFGGGSGPISPYHRHKQASEETMEDATFTPPHGAVSMEFRRVRGDPACMTERVRTKFLNSMPRNVTVSGSGPGISSSVADACMCLEGLWCGSCVVS